MITISEQLFSYTNIIVLLFLALFFYIGYKRGLVRSILSVLFSVLSLFIAWNVAAVLAKVMPIWPVNIYALQHTPMADAAKQLMNQFAWFILLSILIKLVFIFINHLLKSVKKIPIIKHFDAVGGGVFGIVEAFFWIFLICVLLNTRIFANGGELIDKTLIKPINAFSSAIVSQISDQLDGVNGMSVLLQGGSNLAEEQKENLENWLIDNGFSDAANSLGN